MVCYVRFKSDRLLGETISVGNSTPEKLVTAFQEIPDHALACVDETWGGWEALKVGTKFETYFSKEMYKLFMWSQCRSTSMPPFYGDLDNLIFWDIRYGIRLSAHGEELNYAKNIRVQAVKFDGENKATVDVKFDVKIRNVKNITTTYTLIREDGQWKIDDIAPHGDKPKNPDQEPALEHSDSIKTDMLNNYRAAEERYKQEQAGKNSTHK